MLRRLLFGLVIALGLIFTFLVPPFQKPDENRHYYQAVALSDLTMTCPRDPVLGTYLPVRESAYTFPLVLKTDEIAHTPNIKFFRSQFGWYFHPPSESVIKATDWCSWSFVGYIPSALGLLIARLSGSLMVEFFAGRIVSLALFLFTLIFGLRLTPPGYRQWLWFFALLPMTLHQVTAISYDAVLLAMVPLIYACLTQFLAHSDRKPPRSTLVLFYVSLLIFVLAKPAMIAFFLLIFLVPKQKLPTRIILLALGLVLTLPFLRPLHYRGLDVGVNPALQAEVIRQDPGHFVSTLARSATRDGEDILWGLIGRFGWLDYQFVGTYYYLAVFIFGALLLSRPPKPIPAKSLVILLTVIIFTYLATYYALYLTWSRIGSDHIIGVQGRYFLPLIPLLALCLSALVDYLRRSARARLLFAAIFSCWLVYQVTHLIYLRYYDYSHYGVNDLELPPAKPGLTSLGSGTYQLSFPADQVKLVGFYFYPRTLGYPGNTYRYALKSHDCQQTIRTGYLDLYGRESGKVLITNLEPVTVSGGSVCLEISPLLSTPDRHLNLENFAGGGAIGLLYLIPSLR